MTTISAGKRGGRSRRGALASDLCELTWLCTYRSTRRRQPVSCPPVVAGERSDVSIWNFTNQ